MYGHEIIARGLVELGVDTAFGVAGDANLYLVDDLVRTHEVRYIAAAHEAAATMMAIGYARSLGRVGVATTTHGPGVTNTLTALVEGVRSGTPILLLVGDTDPARPSHPQSIAQREIATLAGAGFEELQTLAEIPEQLARASWRAATERRPIMVNMPIQLQWMEHDYQPNTRRWPVPQAPSADTAVLDDAVGLAASAHRPIVVAGRGALHARDELVALAQRLGAPLATTALASNLFRGEPYDLGVFGTLAHPIALEAIAAADCVLFFGASLSSYTTDSGRLLDGKRVVQCDDTATRLGATAGVDIGVVGDAKTTAALMVSMLEALDHTPSGFRDDKLQRQLRERAWLTDYADRTTAETIDPRTFTLALDQALPDDRTVVVDVGRFMLHGLLVPVPDPSALVTTHGFQSIGLGTGTAVGAGAARPERPVVLLVGDGGFMMGGLAEFQTAVRSGIDLVAVVYNDGSYGAEHVQLYRKSMDPQVSMHEWPDFADVAVALGGNGITVRTTDDLDPMRHAIADRDRPLLIDVRLDPDVMSALMG